MSKYAKEELTQIAYDAMECFSEGMHFDISPENTILAFFTPENGIKVYEDLCKRYFPDWLNENYSVEGYFNTFAASAFVGEKYGILIRLDLDMTAADWFEIFLHEISHIYCTVNEIDGGYFFDKYCNQKSDYDNGIINAGYAIWREAVADIMAHTVTWYPSMYTLEYVKPMCLELQAEIYFENPDSKKAVSLFLAYLMLTNEVRNSQSWQQAEQQIREVINFDDEMIYPIIKSVYQNLQKDDYWTITPDFIMNIGEAYLWLLTNKSLKGVVQPDNA